MENFKLNEILLIFRVFEQIKNNSYYNYFLQKYECNFMLIVTGNEQKDVENIITKTTVFINQILSKTTKAKKQYQNIKIFDGMEFFSFDELDLIFNTFQQIKKHFKQARTTKKIFSEFKIVFVYHITEISKKITLKISNRK